MNAELGILGRADLIVIDEHRHVPIVVEIKTGGSQLTARQRIMEEKAKRYGIPYTIVRDRVDEILEVL